MSLPNELLPVGLLGTGAATGGYQISRSLRFNSADSAYLSRTPASAGNRKTWTWAGWVKRSAFGTAQVLFSATDGTTPFTIYLDTDDTLFIGDPAFAWKITAQKFRDSGAWGHLVVAVDTTQASNANRAKIYWNNTQVSLAGDRDLYSNTDLSINGAFAHNIGRSASSSSQYFSGYLADVHFIDGQALTPSSFTETDATTGQLIPKAYTGSFGTNGFWLKFSDNSAATATTLGKDYSGNSNNWTPNNLSVTAGAGNDSLVDTPTSYGTDTGAGGEVRGNYCTLNPLGTAGATPTNGNLSVSSSSTVGNRISTFFLTSGKWYWEGSGTGYVGAIVGRGGEGFTGSISATGSKAIGWWPVDGVAYWDGGNSGTGTTYSSTDVIGIALDMDAGTVKFYKNNTLIHNLTFGSGTVPNFSTGVFPGYNVGASTTSVDINFGQRPFAYTAPSGFKALCDTNLPAPVVAKSSDYFQTVLWTGNSSTQTVSGLSFSPDLVWLKCRNDAYGHRLLDTVRGATIGLASQSTAAESTESTGLTAFNSDGFTLGNNVTYNESAKTYVGWAFDAGTTTTTNTAGSITSQVRANASAGFSIVTYTGTLSGNGNATVGHGLGVAPQLVITKARSATSRWAVQMPTALSANNYLELNTTAAQSSWGTQTRANPTSTVFDTIYAGGVNESGVTYVAYCFAPVAGYSSFGSYTGNGSADGPFVYTGFRPKFVLIKGSSFVSNWNLLDGVRDSYNVADKILRPNLSNAELNSISAGSGFAADFLSNGFKLRASLGDSNSNAETFVWAAFAESPFAYSRAR